MEQAPFDLRALFAAIDAERERQGIGWAALSRQVGVAASTIRRFGRADDAEADGVLALVRWLGVTPEAFTTSGSAAGRPLPDSGDGFVRVDMELVSKARGDPRGASGRTRTTIQDLVEVAQRARQPVASLTRLRER